MLPPSLADSPPTLTPAIAQTPAPPPRRQSSASAATAPSAPDDPVTARYLHCCATVCWLERRRIHP
eukprot:1588208-Prymnesium_polylepis.1